jgi:hypothetical protein
MSKNKCCKNCRRLYFFDWYFCGRNGIYIEDVDLKCHCKYYKRRIGKFWIGEDGEF